MRYLLVAVLAAAIITVCSTEGCGIGPSKAAGRIVGGILATENFPWQVALFDRSLFICGGSIIANSWIVTAAHCVRWRSSGRLSVAYGTLDYNDANRTFIQQYIMHSGYNPYTIISANDIALIQLKKPLQFNTDVVGKVCIPTISVPSDSNVTATGFGLLTNGDKSSKLYRVEIPVVSCARYGIKFKHESFICSGSSGQGTCYGDSGGPVMFNRNNIWELQGIINFGPTRCTRPITQNIGINARVVHFRSWINSTCNCLDD